MALDTQLLAEKMDVLSLCQSLGTCESALQRLADKLIGLIERDVALAARVMAVANSNSMETPAVCLDPRHCSIWD
jgi:HD-like signal output (HDOD) protein